MVVHGRSLNSSVGNFIPWGGGSPIHGILQVCYLTGMVWGKLPYIRVYFWNFALQKGAFLGPKVPFCWKLKSTESYILGHFLPIFSQICLTRGSNFCADTPLIPKVGVGNPEMAYPYIKIGEEPPWSILCQSLFSNSLELSNYNLHIKINWKCAYNCIEYKITSRARLEISVVVDIRHILCIQIWWKRC